MLLYIISWLFFILLLSFCMYEVICILYHAHWLMLDMPEVCRRNSVLRNVRMREHALDLEGYADVASAASGVFSTTRVASRGHGPDCPRLTVTLRGFRGPGVRQSTREWSCSYFSDHSQSS